MGIQTNNTLAFCLFKYFPYGGLQRDMLRIASACQSRGYAIQVYTQSWEGEAPKGLDVHLAQLKALTNHGRARQYHIWLRAQLEKDQVVCTIGFNKMPGLDVYFAGDICFKERALRKHSVFYRLTARYRVYSEFEAAVFSPASRTQIMLISEAQRATFQKHYGTPHARMHLLPPWISQDRRVPDNKQEVREIVRRELGVREGEVLLIQIGSGFGTKGVDRSIRAVGALPRKIRSRTKLIVIGRGHIPKYERLARRLGLTDNVRFVGQRHDVMDSIAAADLMIHPARDEAAGVVLIEALASGLPVLCTGICGHARHIQQANAGCVLSEPFRQEELDICLLDMLTAGKLQSYSENAQAYGKSMDYYCMPERAADIIESVVQSKLTQ